MTSEVNRGSKPFEIVLGVDGSRHAGLAIEWVRGLIGHLSRPCKVSALGVIAGRHRPSRSTLLAALHEAETKLQGSTAEIQTGILHGHPAQQLVQWAERHTADLLVVGAQGSRPYLGVMGGVAQQVVEHACLPVLIVRQPYADPKLVVAAIDGSASSHAALQYLAEFPLPTGCRVDVVTVLPDEEESGDQAGAGEEEVDESSRAADTLAAGVDLLRSAGLSANPVQLRGEPGPALLEHLQAGGADLVVAGSRGLSAVKGWLLGSVSRRLVYHAPCSVLIVKAKDED